MLKNKIKMLEKETYELSQSQLDTLYEKIKGAVYEEFSDAILHSEDKYHSFITVKRNKHEIVAIIDTNKKLLKTKNKNYKNRLFELAMSLQENVGGSWSYIYSQKRLI